MNDADTDDTGGSDEDPVLRALREADRSPLSAGEVATRLDRGRDEVRTRLQGLADDGRVERVDAEHRAWWSLPGRTSERAPDAPEPPEGNIVATGVDPAADDGLESPPPGPAPDPGENLWAGVEWKVTADGRGVAAAVAVVLLVLGILAALLRRR
jgi:biotin operon repressor